MVIISSLGCNGRGIVEFKTLDVVRKTSSRVQNLDSSLFRQQVAEILRETSLKVGGAEEVEVCKDIVQAQGHSILILMKTSKCVEG